MVILRSISGSTDLGQSTEHTINRRRDGEDTAKVEIDIDLAGSRTVKTRGVKLRAFNSIAFITSVTSTCVSPWGVVSTEGVVVAVIEVRVGAFINVEAAVSTIACVATGARSTGARSNHVGAVGERVASSIIDLTFIDIFVA